MLFPSERKILSYIEEVKIVLSKGKFRKDMFTNQPLDVAI